MPTRSSAVRAVWNARGGFRYSLDPLRSVSIRRFPSFSAGTPSGGPARPDRSRSQVADADPPRVLSSTLREPRTESYRRLTSPVAAQARLTGSSRLAAALLRAAQHLSMQCLTHGVSPAWPGPPSDRPVKGDHSTTQDACHRVLETSRAFAHRVRSRASSVRIPRATCTPVRLLPTAARVSAHSAAREGFRLRRFPSG